MAKPVALLFPGQGAQQPGMAAGLYHQDEVFTAVMDQAFDLLGIRGAGIREEWLADEPGPRFDDVTVAQPLLYSVEYALGRMVLDWGIEPAAVLGHSVGEMVGATLAGVLTFADGIRLMLDRVHHYAASPPGGMLAVAASADEARPFLYGSVAVAAVNAGRQILLAGPDDELTVVAKALRESGFTCRAARARQAFHSPVVAGAATATIDAWRSVRLRPPRVPVYSGHLGRLLDAGTAMDPVFWAMQPTTTVLFWPTLDLLLRSQEVRLLDIGPGQGLAAIARRHPAVASGRSDVLALLPARRAGPQADRDAVHRAAERIAA